MRIINTRINDTNNINQLNTNFEQNWPQVINFKEHFNYSEVEPEDYKRAGVDDETALLSQILTKLVTRIVRLGLDLRHGKKKRQGDYILEAYFVPKSKDSLTEPYIFLPLNIEYDLIAKQVNNGILSFDVTIADYISRVVAQTDNPGLIRLVTVLAHEFGHFLSYCRGNHDKNLARGLLAMHRDRVLGMDKVTYLVFIEESLAWRYGQEELSHTGFEWWKVYEKIKFSSLQAYFQRLQLAKASLSIYMKLSWLDDFHKSSASVLFGK